MVAKLTNKVRKHMSQGLKKLLWRCGYGMDFYAAQPWGQASGLAINVGAGDWECPGWINLDYPSEHYASAQAKHSFIPYDIRSDALPFHDGAVEMIYTSNVIEHIENQHIQRLFDESYRLLTGGVLRIVCPDAEFFYHMTKLGKNYWNLRRASIENMGLSFETLRAVDCLVADIAAPKLLGYGDMQGEDYEDAFHQLSMYDFFDYLTGDIEFDVKRVGDHINYWTFQKLEDYLKKSGFRTVIRSTYLGSSKYVMQNRRYFDRTGHGLSLYVEAIK